MTITKDDGGVTVAPGETIAYTLTFANIGNANATGVVLTETVPTLTTFNAGASTGGWFCLPDNSEGSFCELSPGTVVAGGMGTVVFAVDLSAFAAICSDSLCNVPGPLTQVDNTASVSDDGNNGTDPNPLDNSDSDTTPVVVPAPG